jgi:hypothetical protein
MSSLKYACSSIALVLCVVGVGAQSGKTLSMPNSVLLFGDYGQLQVVTPGGAQGLRPPVDLKYNGGYFAFPGLAPRGDVIAWGSQPSRPSTEWSALLEAFTRHDERGKAVVQNGARHVRQSPERELARLLLDEWGRPVQRQRLAHPEIVLLAGVARSTRTVPMEIFDLNVRVGSDGRVTAAAFVKPPRQPWLSREVLVKGRAALFQPAFRAGRFVESEFVMT